MKRAGLILVTLGILALVFGSFSYNGQRTVIEMGGIKATATERHTLPLPPYVGVLTIVAGALLIITPRRRWQA